MKKKGLTWPILLDRDWRTYLLSIVKHLLKNKRSKKLQEIHTELKLPWDRNKNDRKRSRTKEHFNFYKKIGIINFDEDKRQKLTINTIIYLEENNKLIRFLEL
ncbi:MAG: hypothetical protein ACTSRP_27130, partial [Candidatus Helarchaeota archaeon]